MLSREEKRDDVTAELSTCSEIVMRRWTMPYDRAGYRDHCGECRHFMLDEERTRLRREVFGEHAAPAHYCGKLHIFVSILDSPQNPSSNAAWCFSYEKGGRNGR